MDDCLFCRIASGAIPARKAYEDRSRWWPSTT